MRRGGKPLRERNECLERRRLRRARGGYAADGGDPARDRRLLHGGRRRGARAGGSLLHGRDPSAQPCDAPPDERRRPEGQPQPGRLRGVARGHARPDSAGHGGDERPPAQQRAAEPLVQRPHPRVRRARHRDHRRAAFGDRRAELLRPHGRGEVPGTARDLDVVLHERGAARLHGVRQRELGARDLQLLEHRGARAEGDGRARRLRRADLRRRARGVVRVPDGRRRHRGVRQHRRGGARLRARFGLQRVPVRRDGRADRELPGDGARALRLPGRPSDGDAAAVPQRRRAHAPQPEERLPLLLRLPRRDPPSARQHPHAELHVHEPGPRVLARLRREAPVVLQPVA